MAVCPNWKGEPFEGFGHEDCVLTPGEDGYTRVQWKRKLMDLENATICLVFRFRKTKLYAFRGEVVRTAERYYEGAPTA